MENNGIGELGQLFDECAKATNAEGSSLLVNDVIGYLLQRCGDIVDQEALKDLLWENLSHSGSKDTIDKDAFLITMQKLGVGFLNKPDGDVEPTDGDDSFSTNYEGKCITEHAVMNNLAQDTFSDSSLCSNSVTWLSDGPRNTSQPLVEVTRELEKVTEEKRLMKEQLTTAEDVNECLTVEIEKLKTQVVHSSNSELVLSLQREVDFLKAENENLMTDNCEQKSEVEKLTIENTRLRNELRQCQNQLEVCQADRERIIESEFELKSALGQCSTDLSSTNHLLMQRDKELASVKHRIESLNGILQECDEKNNQLYEENISLKSQLMEEKKQKIASLSKRTCIQSLSIQGETECYDLGEILNEDCGAIDANVYATADLTKNQNSLDLELKMTKEAFANKIGKKELLSEIDENELNVGHIQTVYENAEKSCQKPTSAAAPNLPSGESCFVNDSHAPTTGDDASQIAGNLPEVAASQKGKKEVVVQVMKWIHRFWQKLAEFKQNPQLLKEVMHGAFWCSLENIQLKVQWLKQNNHIDTISLMLLSLFMIFVVMLSSFITNGGYEMKHYDIPPS